MQHMAWVPQNRSKEAYIGGSMAQFLKCGVRSYYLSEIAYGSVYPLLIALGFAPAATQTPTRPGRHRAFETLLSPAPHRKAVVL